MSVNANSHVPFVRGVARVAATTLLLTASILQGQVSSISVTPPPGEYTRAQSVTATSEPAGASLHYTSNGTAPSSSSPRVFGALPINRSLTLLLQAFANGQTASDVFAFDFVITGQVAAGGTHTLALRADGTVWSVGLNDRGQLEHIK